MRWCCRWWICFNSRLREEATTEISPYDQIMLFQLTPP